MSLCIGKIDDRKMIQAHIVFLSHIMTAFASLEEVPDYVNIRIQHKRLRLHAFCWSNATTYAEFYELNDNAQLGHKICHLQKETIQVLLEQLKEHEHD